MKKILRHGRNSKPSDGGSTAGDIVWILSYEDLIPGNRQLVTDGAYDYISDAYVSGDAFTMIIGCSGSVSVSDLSFNGTYGDDITVYDTTDYVKTLWPEWVEDYTWYTVEFSIYHNTDSWYEIINNSTRTRVRVNYAISGISEQLPMYFRPNSTTDDSVNPRTDSDTFYVGDLANLDSEGGFDTTVTINGWVNGDVLDPAFFCDDLPDNLFPDGYTLGNIIINDCENVDIYASLGGSGIIPIRNMLLLKWLPSNEIKKSPSNRSYDPHQYAILNTDDYENTLYMKVSLKDTSKPGKIVLVFRGENSTYIRINIILNSL